MDAEWSQHEVVSIPALGCPLLLSARTTQPLGQPSHHSAGASVWRCKDQLVFAAGETGRDLAAVVIGLTAAVKTREVSAVKGELKRAAVVEDLRAAGREWWMSAVRTG